MVRDNTETSEHNPQSYQSAQQAGRFETDGLLCVYFDSHTGGTCYARDPAQLLKKKTRTAHYSTDDLSSRFSTPTASHQHQVSRITRLPKQHSSRVGNVGKDFHQDPVHSLGVLEVRKETSATFDPILQYYGKVSTFDFCSQVYPFELIETASRILFTVLMLFFR